MHRFFLGELSWRRGKKSKTSSKRKGSESSGHTYTDASSGGGPGSSNPSCELITQTVDYDRISSAMVVAQAHMSTSNSDHDSETAKNKAARKAGTVNKKDEAKNETAREAKKDFIEGRKQDSKKEKKLKKRKTKEIDRVATRSSMSEGDHKNIKGDGSAIKTEKKNNKKEKRPKKLKKFKPNKKEKDKSKKNTAFDKDDAAKNKNLKPGVPPVVTDDETYLEPELNEEALSMGEPMDRWRPTMDWGIKEPQSMRVKLIPDRLTTMEQLVQPPPPDKLKNDIKLYNKKPPDNDDDETEPEKKTGKKDNPEKNDNKDKKNKNEKEPKDKIPGTKQGLVDEPIQVHEKDIRDSDDPDDDIKEFLKPKNNPADDGDYEGGRGDGDKEHDYTGMFLDGQRRIDYILVTSERDDPKEEELKVNFLMSLLKLGLQLEFHKGQQKEHQHLNFIKVHAPDHVLDEFAEPLGVKKYFTASHFKHIGEDKSWDEKRLGPKHEKTWIKLVRERYIQPLGYSNHDRSLIVYMLLRNQPFGIRRNHFGLQRLLNHNIFVDGYALHDGPYFFVRNQDYLRLNARQILNYNWIGSENALRYQPKNLIHEYYGPKIAFYFTYYELYNKFLLIFGIFGVFIFFMQVLRAVIYLNRDQDKNDFWRLRNEICGNYHNVSMCPECRNFTLCPFRQMNTYCPDIVWSNFFDNEFVMYFCLFINLWVPIFYIFWRRRETYKIWLWELKYKKIEPVTPIVRSEYRANFNIFRWRAEDGRWTDTDRFFFRLLRYLAGALVAIIFLCILGFIYYNFILLHISVPGEITLSDTNIVQYKSNFIGGYKKIPFNESFAKLESFERDAAFKYVITGQHKILAGLTVLFCFLLFSLESLYHLVTRAMVMVENHRLQRDHESRQVTQLFATSFMVVFPILVFIGWIKGVFRTLPYAHFATKYKISLPLLPIKLTSIEQLINSKLSKLFKKTASDWPAELIHMNCGPFNCIDKLVLLTYVIFMLRFVLFRIVYFIPCWKTDYTKREMYLSVTPSWEREYRLKSITEVQIVQYFNEIILQFAFLVYLSPWCPLMPIIAFFINCCDMKHKARLFLLHSRRPTLFQTEGIRRWNSILQGILYSIPIIHAITFVRNTKLGFTYTYFKYKNRHNVYDPKSNLFNYSMTHIEMDTLKKVSKLLETNINEHLQPVTEALRPNACVFTGIYNKLSAVQLKSMPFPFKWYNITDKVTSFSADSGQFFKNFHENAFIIAYSHIFLLITLLLIYYIPQEITKVKEHLQIEKILRKVHILNKVKIPPDNHHRPPLPVEIKQKH